MSGCPRRLTTPRSLLLAGERPSRCPRVSPAPAPGSTDPSTTPADFCSAAQMMSVAASIGLRDLVVTTEEDLANTPPDALAVFVNGATMNLPPVPKDPDDHAALCALAVRLLQPRPGLPDRRW
jgi:hypothetical protein